MDISWSLGQRIAAVTLDAGLSWTFALEANASLQVDCLWRILEKGRIILTSEDHSQLFGLPAPLDAQEIAGTLLAGKPITGAFVCGGTLDIILDFANGRRLEVLPTSSGYESWHLIDPSRNMTIAQGGGNLVTFKL